MERYKIKMENKIFSLLMILPLWIVNYPPMTDLPQHAAQINTILEYNNPATHYREYFRLNWFTPYLFGNLFILLFANFLPLLTSLKIVVSLSLLGLPLAASLINKENCGKPEWIWIIFPTAMGYAFYWGFINFIIAIPIVIFALYLTMRYLDSPSLKKKIGLILLLHLLFFSHGLLLVFTVGICSILIIFNSNSFKSRLNNLIPFMSVLPIVSIWFYSNLHQENQIREELFIGNYGLHRLLEIFSQIMGKAPEPEYILLGLPLYLIPILLGGKIRKRIKYWIPFIFCLGIYFIFPLHIFGIGFLYPRFSIFLLPFFLLIIERKSKQNKKQQFYRVVSSLYIIGLLLMPLNNFFIFKNENEGFKQIINELKPNKKMLSMVFERNSEYFQTPVYLHFPLWYQAEKDGIVDFNFALYYPEIVRYREDKKPKVTFGFEWNPDRFKWVDHEASKYNYFLIRSSYNLSSFLFKGYEKNIKLINYSNKWWLFEIK
jgi:hypothetical protein